jgi:hypothetical protein
MMQSQGLGALMPQAAQQMAPQQPPPNPQRLAAATNLVSSDAERQILDPRTLALIKYKDAIQAMQAADQMMAAAQPQPMPPTVAERTKLAAEQGIAGLASKLGAGIQQQGSNMQAQQMQQAMSGGLPQLPAPNMARMAGGGIVSFQEGGSTSSDVEALIAQFVASGMDPLAAAEEAARTLGITPEVPSTTYGTGDRTGQGENLMGVLQGSGQVMADAARRFAPQGMSEEELTALTTSEGGGRQSRLPEMSEEELLALTTSEGAEPRPDSPGITDELKRRTGALKETLGRDLSFLSVFAPTQGFGVRPEPRNIFARGEPEAETASAAPDTESEMASIGRLPTQELEQIEAEVESDPNAFQRLADWVVENPYDAVSMGLIAIPGIGLAGGLGMRGVSALMRSPAVRRAVQSLYSRPNPRTARVFDPVTNTMTRGAPGPARTFAPGRAMFTAGTGMTAAGQVANMMGGDGEGEGLASLPIDSAAPADTSADTPAAAVEIPSTPQPAPEDMGPNATPAQFLRANAGTSRDAVDAVLEAEAQPRAGESASDRAARMRRLIAGLRGFGAQGLGGFAAGASEEELRQEQEGIAEQERQRRAAMETRGLDLEERGLTQRDEILRMEIANQQREAQEMMDLRYEQLAATHGAAVADAIAAQTSFLVPRIIELRTVLADPSYERGFFGKRDELEAELAKQEAVLSATEAEVYALYGPAPTSSPRVSGGAGGGYESVSNEDLLRSLGGN